MRPLTVQQVIDRLNQVVDKSLTVTIGGCDCAGEAGSVFLFDGNVWIDRTDSEQPSNNDRTQVFT